MKHSTQQAWKQFWDVTAESANPLSAIDLPEISQQTYRAATLRISQLLTLSSHDTVLNIGCGPGLFEERFAGTVKRIIGVDFAYTMVNKALQRNNETGNTSFCQASGTALPFKDNQFTKVLCYSVLHYFSEADVIQLLSEIHRVSSKGAIVLLGDVEDVSEPSTDSIPVRLTDTLSIGGLKRLVYKGTKRVRTEVRRRVVRLKRKWQMYTGQYVVASKPHHLFNYSRSHLLTLVKDAGYDGQIVEQKAERFVHGRYHVVLQVP